MLSRFASRLVKRSLPCQRSCPRLLHSAYRYRSHYPRSPWCVDRYRSLPDDRHLFAPRFMSTQKSELRDPKFILNALKETVIESIRYHPLQAFTYVIVLVLCAVVLFGDLSDAADKLRSRNDHRTRCIMSGIVYFLVTDNVLPLTADASDPLITFKEHGKLLTDSGSGLLKELRSYGDVSTELALHRWHRFLEVLLSINEKHMFSSNRATGLSKAEREAREMTAELQRRVKEESERRGSFLSARFPDVPATQLLDAYSAHVGVVVAQRDTELYSLVLEIVREIRSKPPVPDDVARTPAELTTDSADFVMASQRKKGSPPNVSEEKRQSIAAELALVLGEVEQALVERVAQCKQAEEMINWTREKPSF